MAPKEAQDKKKRTVGDFVLIMKLKAIFFFSFLLILNFTKWTNGQGMI
jgi:hypothetical protein